MRILVVTIVHHPEDARIRHRQISALLTAGHEVTYAAPFKATRVQPAGDVTAVTLPRATGRHRLAAIAAARKVIKARRTTADVIVLHDPELLLAVGGVRGLPPVVWDVHEDTAAALTLKAWFPRPLRGIARAGVAFTERYAERRYHLLLAEEAYQERFRRPHPIVPNTTWVPETVRPPGYDRVVYLGHLTRARGALDMIEVGRLLGAAISVELIGGADDEVRPALEAAAAAGHVKWHGFVPNDTALGLIEGSLAGLSLLHDEPNYRHSRPTKVLEYMARGVPVIATPSGPSRDLLERHGAGILVPFEDAAAAVEVIKRLHNDPELRAELGRNGHNAALEHYAWPRYGHAFVAQLEAWAAQHRQQTRAADIR